MSLVRFDCTVLHPQTFSPLSILYILVSIWASLMAQLVKNLPATQETLVREDPLEKG